jgi:hypothetical protein
MAKKKTSRRGSAKLNAGAETIGTALGRVAAKLDAWKKQRAEIAGDIQKLLRSAQGMLGDLGETAGRNADALLSFPGSSRKGGRPKGYKMSEATKRKLRAAWKRRKAAASKANPS